ncbi:MAG: M48 family metalloprotease [Oscillospiraceae bacterium]|jgi:heat shock protein HtpX|nr:M48 family metalloprotease [Oscillospiraceae bacterium]
MSSIQRAYQNLFTFISKNPVYLVCSIIYYVFAVWFIGGFMWWAWVFFALIYIISLGVAFSPLGETLLRLFNRVRRLETAREKQYLRPIFQEVYDKAKTVNPELGKIELHIIDTMSVNACALGQHTIAVTKGAMKPFSEEELKAILTHEIAHILNMDTMALIYTMIGNGIFSVLISIVKVVYWLMGKIETLRPYVDVADKLFEGMTFAFLFLMQIALAVSDRKAEKRADEYTITLGYGEDMVEALYLLEEISLDGGEGIIQKLLASHPRVTRRIENLEVRLGVQDGK